MEVKPGYKQSEIGAIPKDWKISLLGDLISSVEYGSSAKSDAQGRMPVIRMGNLQDGKIVWHDLVYTSNEAEISRYALYSGDVLFNRTNTVDLVGKTSIYKGEHPAVFAGYLIRINVKKLLLDTKYLNYVLNAHFSKHYSLEVLSVAVSQANINATKLRTYPIPLPPTKAEQEAIAGALSDADALIESLEQLLAKKRNLKQAAMQELLTGKKRLPGFKDKWEETALSQIGNCYRGVSYNPNKDLFDCDTESTVRLLRSNNVQEAKLDLAGIQYVDSGRVSDVQHLCADDILICMANGSRDLVGKAAKITVDDGLGYTFGAFMGCFRPEKLAADPDFVFYLFQTEAYRSHIAVLLAGSSINNLTPGNVEAFAIDIPTDKTEQTAIATVLGDMDTEITALDAKLSKARQIKQGMMQELLTGRIRLV